MPVAPDAPEADALSSGGVPLSVLDLAPVSEGSTVGAALRNTIDLARRAESFGYRRYWVAEHHFVPGVASSSPAVLIAAIAAATSRIRVGSGAVQLGHQTAAAVVEAFGTLAELFPGRIDLGVGRSGQRRHEVAREAALERTREAAQARPPGAAPPAPYRTVNGLLIPAKSSQAHLRSPRLAAQSALLQQPGAQLPDFAGQVEDILALLAGSYSASGIPVEAVPGAGADAEVWVLGSSGGQSARVAGELGLPFAVSYHISPATALEALDGYRAAFRPSAVLASPHVLVSADAVVAPTSDEARRLAEGYALWVRSVRSGAGAMRFPAPDTVAGASWTAEDRALVEDRVSTQFVGSPETVAGQLRVLQSATGADELLVTTVTHRHSDRVRSYELLAREWGGAAGLS
jgi:alkanesulfonate monooxygenase SsuD/methylene tetrahydromethanopterin reductase-like flavin-dependent oxidoreductase (luciferase family)